MNCKFNHKEHSGKAAPKSCGESRLNHEGGHEEYEDYNENTRTLRILRALSGKL